ncbi:hypothetical protein C0Q70_02412 [Pomacea canaliculata]|uniref:Chordin n=1 Tax=Pomacea canaliculata TaxID=400727 RepID=A0A2T7PPX0_POMCA|nr:hypothetical protein C0Q70_02412 [Pomacea canaliculata]
MKINLLRIRSTTQVSHLLCGWEKISAVTSKSLKRFVEVVNIGRLLGIENTSDPPDDAAKLPLDARRSGREEVFRGVNSRQSSNRGIKEKQTRRESPAVKRDMTGRGARGQARRYIDVAREHHQGPQAQQGASNLHGGRQQGVGGERGGPDRDRMESYEWADRMWQGAHVVARGSCRQNEAEEECRAVGEEEEEEEEEDLEARVPQGKNDFETNFTFRPKGKVTGLYSEDQQHYHKVNEFRALLTGRNVRRHPVRTSSVAIIYMTVERGELRYAVRYSKLDGPKFLQITDVNGKVIFEKPIEKPRHQKGGRKLCGVWQKIPTVYLQYFRQERLFAVITASKYPDGLVAGRIVPNDMTATEIFSSVLSSKTSEGIGGMASFEFDPTTNLLKYVIHVDSLVNAGEAYIPGLLMSRTTKLAGTWKMSKKKERNQLARGRLRVRVVSHNGAAISGIVQPRLTCEAFQAVLSGSNALETHNAVSAGSAIVDLTETGGLEFKVNIGDKCFNSTFPGSSSRKKNLNERIVANLHGSFSADNQSFDGWTNGTYKKLDAKDIYNLLNNRLYINVATRSHRVSELRGRLVPVPFSSQPFSVVSVTSAPAVLQPVSAEAGGGAAHAWLSMDVGCLLRYEAVVARVGTNNEVEDVSGSFGVVLGSLDNRLQKISSGSVANLTEGMFHDLDKGRAFLQINSGPDSKAIFRGNVSLPNTCWQYAQDLESTVAVDEQRLSEGDGPSLRCYFEGTFYDVGDSWLPDINATCNTCSCMVSTKGKVVCHAVICPRLTCRNPIKLDSECCPTCPDESWSGTCTLGKDPRQYPLQRSWHPFLPLSGFAKCVTCTCKSHKNPICSRLECPKLNCPGRELVKSPEDCCPVCGREFCSFPSFAGPLFSTQFGTCNFMGEWKADGDSWHPRVKPFGYMKCFLCTCKAGEFTCGRTQCPELTCKRKIRSSQSCCDECDPNHQEEEDADSKEEKGCTFGGKSYAHRAKWRPPAAPTGDSRCAKCTCKDGKVRCKIRCPKNCDGDGGASPCCKHCEDQHHQEAAKAGAAKVGEQKLTAAKACRGEN